MYGLLYECKFLTIEETNKKKEKKKGVFIKFSPFSFNVFETKWKTEKGYFKISL
jgi:hypothetical protein